MFHDHDIRRGFGLSRRALVRLTAVIITVVALLALQMKAVGAETGADSTASPTLETAADVPVSPVLETVPEVSANPTLETVPVCVQISCTSPTLIPQPTFVLPPPTLADPPTSEPSESSTTTSTVPESATTTTTAPEATTTTTTAPEASTTTTVGSDPGAGPAVDAETAAPPPPPTDAPEVTVPATNPPSDSHGSSGAGEERTGFGAGAPEAAAEVGTTPSGGSVGNSGDPGLDTDPVSDARMEGAGVDGDSIPLAPVDPAVVAVPLFTD